LHGPNFPKPLPDIIEGNKEWEVEEIIGERVCGVRKKTQFRVRWKGWSATHDTWEPEENVHAPELIQKFCSKGERDKRPHRGKREASIHCQVITMSEQNN
jgi:chromodomain-containing protein